MERYIRLSETELATEWLAQFRTSYDSNVAKELLDSLKYVSTREFEVSIETKLIELQRGLQDRIAVYPVKKTDAYYSLFRGKFITANVYDSNSKPPRVGTKMKFGSEDKIASLLEKISSRTKRNSNLSEIECNPTIKTINSQGIKNIVLVDDLCGSGDRITGFYKNIFPASIKRLISFNKIKLWILVYAASSDGVKKIRRKIKYFNKNIGNVIIIFPETRRNSFSPQIVELCERMGSGYKGSFTNIIFEHGCPNNIPNMLWFKKKYWKPLFPHRTIPFELRPSFGNQSTADLGSILWVSGQKQLALSLYDAIDRNFLSSENSLRITVLGLLAKNVRVENIAEKMLIEPSRLNGIISDFIDEDILYKHGDKILINALGMGIVSTFRNQKKRLLNINIDKPKIMYYPTQCDGHFKLLGSLPSNSIGGCTDK